VSGVEKIMRDHKVTVVNRYWEMKHWTPLSRRRKPPPKGREQSQYSKRKTLIDLKQRMVEPLQPEIVGQRDLNSSGALDTILIV